MKTLLPFAIGLIPVSIIGLNSIWDFPVERYLISFLDHNTYFSSTNPFFVAKLFMHEIVTAFYIIASVSYFISPYPAWKERVYYILRTAFCINFLFSAPNFFYSLDSFTPDWNNTAGYFAILRFFINLFISLVLFSAQTYPPIPRINISGFTIVEHAPKGARLMHHIADLFFLIAITDSWYLIVNSTLSFSTDTALLFLANIISYFLYFFLSETLFRQTPGQAIMDSCVAGINRKMGPKKALLRSFGRLIPFDRYSFLWGGNWHDKVSNTTVVRKNSWRDLVFDAERQ